VNLNDFNQSKYLAGRELPEGGLDLTIGGFEVVKLQDGTSKPAILWTTPGMKPMLLNKTNRLRLEVIFRTAETTALIGQRVGVFFDRMVQGPNGDMVGGLRLRPAGYNPNPVPAAPVAPQAAPTPTGLELAQLRAAQALQAKQVGPAGADPFDQEVPF
jgi:hypothetical protein